MATKPAPKETTEKDSQVLTGEGGTGPLTCHDVAKGGEGLALMTRLNANGLAGANTLRGLVDYSRTRAAQEVFQENKAKGRKVSELTACTKNMTSGMFFGMGYSHLGPPLLIQVQNKADKKKADEHQKQEKKNTKKDETWDRAQSLKEKDEKTWNLVDLKTMVAYKSRPNDTPQKTKKLDLKTQWNNRKNRKSPQRTRASTEEIDDLLLASLQPWQEKGSAMLADILLLLTAKIQATLNTLAAHLQGPFLILGSWPALKILQSMNDECLQDTLSTLSKLKANDIDVYQGLPGNGECEIIIEGITKGRIEDVDLEVNIVPVKNFNAQSLLENNDINATAVAINVHEFVPGQPAKFTVGASAHFWEFILSESHVLKAVNPERAKARSLVRMAYKSFEMGLPFDDSGIDPGSEVLYKSHQDKFHAMKDWAGSPFADMYLERAENERNAVWLKRRDAQ
jgi:hypothetical protein